MCVAWRTSRIGSSGGDAAATTETRSISRLTRAALGAVIAVVLGLIAAAPAATATSGRLIG